VKRIAAALLSIGSDLEIFNADRKAPCVFSVSARQQSAVDFLSSAPLWQHKTWHRTAALTEAEETAVVTKRAPRPVDSNLFEPSLIDIRKLVEVIEPYRAERLLSKTSTILNTPWNFIDRFVAG
jgi:hypothetical protein